MKDFFQKSFFISIIFCTFADYYQQIEYYG